MHIRQQTVGATANIGFAYSASVGLPAVSGNWAVYNETTDPSFFGGAVTINTGALTMAAVTGTTLVLASTAATSFTFAGGGTIAGTLSCSNGIQITAGDLTSRADADAQTILGRIRCGFFTGLSDNAAFAHYDHATSSSYAMRQDSSGATVINSASGQNLRLSINNTAVMTVTSALATIASGIPLRLGNAAVAATPTATHTITVQDSGGTTYRLLCVV